MKFTLQELQYLIDHHDYLYHTLDKPEISDAEYDDLYKLYVKMGGTIKVGAEPNAAYKIKHTKPMLSLDKAYDFEEIEQFIERINKIVKNQKLEFIAEPKIDGLSLSLRYEKGVLVRAATRGNGYIGEDVTENARYIASIPKKIKYSNVDTLEVRGEVYMLHKDFENLNQKQQHDDNRLFANPRNAAAGSLRQLDANITKQRNLQFFAYGCGEINETSINTQFELLQLYKKIGFTINKHTRLCKSIAELQEYYSYIEGHRAYFGYDIDGVVYKINSFILQNRLGNTSHSPRWAIAHKFSAEQANTIVNSIDIQVGRTGVLTPVARLEPVNVGGVVITNASLHNEDYIKNKDIRIGDSVILQRAGDVIPQIVKVIFEKRPSNNKIFIFPEYCPVCSSLCVREHNTSAYRCTGGLLCEAQTIERMKHFVSKQAFNIDGLGEKQVEFFYSKKYIKDVSEIFTLEQRHPNLFEEEGFGKTSVKNLFISITNSKNINLGKFIFALGIRYCGEVNAQKIARYFKTYDNFANKAQKMASGDLEAVQEFLSIEGLGDVAIQAISDFYNEKHNLEIIEKLLKNINIINESENRNNKFNNLTILFTGTLATMSREEAKTIAIVNGANIASSVSKNVSLLVAGEKAGTKLKKAQELNIKIIFEDEWLKLLEE